MLRGLVVTALIICFTPLFFLFGVVLYRLVRPTETVAEANERALAEEAMLVEVEAQAHCADCGRSVQPGWIICPTCRNRLRRVCPECGKLVELDWSLCAWCGKDFEPPARLAQPLPAVRATDGRALPAARVAEAPAPAEASTSTATVTSLGHPVEATAPVSAPRSSVARSGAAPRPSAQRQ